MGIWEEGEGAGEGGGKGEKRRGACDKNVSYTCVNLRKIDFDHEFSVTLACFLSFLGTRGRYTCLEKSYSGCTERSSQAEFSECLPSTCFS